MSKIKFLKISSVQADDVNDLFEAICKDIIHITPTRAKRNILGMTGKDSNIEKYKCTLSQLMAVIQKYDIPVDIKVSYADLLDTTDQVLKPKEDNHGLEKDVLVTAMTKQEKEITNPELRDVAIVAEKKNEATAAVDPGKIQDIPDFI
jgi:hypothetical protein